MMGFLFLWIHTICSKCISSCKITDHSQDGWSASTCARRNSCYNVPFVGRWYTAVGIGVSSHPCQGNSCFFMCWERSSLTILVNIITVCCVVLPLCAKIGKPLREYFLCVHRCADMCVPVWSVKLRRHLGYCFSGPISLVFETGSVSLVCDSQICLCWLAGLGAPGTCLSMAPHHWDYKHMPPHMIYLFIYLEHGFTKTN